jgi:D-inositol-3-phosphate glycosyltransferase
MLIVPATEWRDYVIDHGADPGKVNLVPYGVDSARFAPMPQPGRERIRRALGLNPDDFVIGCFGRQGGSENRKEPATLECALGMLKQEHGRLVLLTTGLGWDEIIGSVRKAGVQAINKVFTPQVQMCKLYNALDCYWVVSRVEGGPLPLLEAMSCAVPVVTSDVGMARDVVHDGVNGLMIAKGDMGALVQNTLKLIGNPALRISVGLSGRQTVLTSYQWAKHAELTRSVYRQVLERREGSGHPSRLASPQRFLDTVLSPRRRALEEEMHWARWLKAAGEPRRARRLVASAWMQYLVGQGGD